MRRLPNAARSCLVAALFAARVVAQAAPADPTGVARLKAEAAELTPIVSTDLAKSFVEATDRLPSVEPRVILVDNATRTSYTPEQAAELPEAGRAKLTERTIDETTYYYTKYGTPLAYSRPIEILAEHGFDRVDGQRILDFGYGTVGHLRLLALLGADAVGVDVDTFLTATYRDVMDQGAVQGAGGRRGRITLVQGQWPADEATKRAVGDGYDLIISKNTLKNGYLHPEREVDPRLLVTLGVEDEAFVRAMFDALNPGGRVLIYNICPAPAPPDKPYIPWADGRCPFPRGMWESAGFRVVALDVDDSPAARTMAHALGWDKGEGGMDLERDLFAHYSLIEKPR